MNLDTLFFPSRVEKENRLVLLDKKEMKSTGLFDFDFIINTTAYGTFDQFKVSFDGISINTSATVSIIMNLNNDYGATQYGGYYLRSTASTVTAGALSTDNIQIGLAENQWRASGEVIISNQKDVWKTVFSTFGSVGVNQISQSNWKNLTDRVNKISIRNGSSTYPFMIGGVFKLYGLR